MKTSQERSGGHLHVGYRTSDDTRTFRSKKRRPSSADLERAHLELCRKSGNASRQWQGQASECESGFRAASIVGGVESKAAHRPETMYCVMGWSTDKMY